MNEENKVVVFLCVCIYLNGKVKSVGTMKAVVESVLSQSIGTGEK